MQHDHTDTQSSCCIKEQTKRRPDWLLNISAIVLTVSIASYYLMGALSFTAPHQLHHFVTASLGILGSMWWGIALGIFIIGVMSKIPRDYFTALMGREGNFSGLLRAVFGGLLLDLCCHGILLVAAKLYERGVSLAQVVTFLVASPWNSVSLTLVLIGLIGLKWTLLYILGSIVIALATGLILQRLIAAKILPGNPNTAPQNENQNTWADSKALFSSITVSKSGLMDILKSGWKDGRMIIKWLLFGVIIAAALRTFVPAEMFADWLGPTTSGLLITLLFATVVEICSEGSAPIASEIVTSAHAPGNGFTFLMAGVATDYTEIMAVREFTRSWAIALAIPLITVPQVILIGILMNMAS